MAFSVEVENIKCGGCATTIRKRIMALEGVTHAEVLVAQGVVKVEADDSVRSAVVEALLQAGYPEAGSAPGIASLKSKAASLVSCAIGRLDEKD